MNERELRERYLTFFEQRGHKRIPSAPLLPENDPSVLFTTAGMHPLAPYLLGEPHPLGQRLTNYQKCIRTNDIDEVGDPTHLTFFEMLGNWSLGDYFKAESLAWSYAFLTEELKIDPERLAVTVFAGDEDAPRDETSAGIWRGLGIPDERIHYLPKSDNWWGPVGETGPCGPDSEIFFNTGKPDHPGCRPGCSCGRWLEIWNNVFMEYEKRPDGSYVKLSKHNVDTGMGVERTVMALNGYDDIFKIDTLAPLVTSIERLSGRRYDEQPAAFRNIVDHLRAVTFAVADGARPSNVEAGYVLRRMLRRAIRYGRTLGIQENFCAKLAGEVIDLYCEIDPQSGGRLEAQRETITQALEAEENKFRSTLERATRPFNRLVERLRNEGRQQMSGQEAFDLFESHGLPLEISVAMAREAGLTVDEAGFQTSYEKHRGRSQRVEESTFKGGLADHSQHTTRLHTATHLLHQALRQVLGPGVQQKGSNITTERLRFDFSHSEALTPDQLAEVERIVNQQIERDLAVNIEIMPLPQALQQGALAFFGEKYGDQVKVYTIGDFSKEVCGGPHVARTGELESFKILKQEAVGQGVRRIRAVVG